MIAFISRGLSSDSNFKNLLERAGWEVRGASLVQLTPLSVSKIPPAEWWFFSSKNAVQFFLPGKNIPPLLRIGALGPATAEAIYKYMNRSPDFVGNGDPESTAKAFTTVAKKQRVLFPGAVNAQQTLQTILSDVVVGTHLNVYDNVPIARPPDMTDAHVLAFTSPMNARAYFNVYPYVAGQRIIAIGATTASVLQELGIEQVETALEPDEKAIVEVVLRGS